MHPLFIQTAFISGLAALAIPVLIHLFFRLRTKRVELGTIRFLRLVLEENARRRKVMQWLLLALRLGCVALLVGLFARPYLTAATSRDDKSLIVILIDESATMHLKSETGRLKDQAIAEAKRLIEQADRQSHVEVAFFDHTVRPITGTEGDSTSLLAPLTKAASEPTKYGSTNYGAAVAWARDLLVNAPPGRKQLHLFTDLQRSGLTWTEVEPLPEAIEVHLHDLGGRNVNNVAVTEVRTPRTWVRPGETAQVRASISHAGAFTLTDIPVKWEVRRTVSNAPLAQQPRSNDVPLKADFTKRERIKLEPGKTFVLEIELPPLTEGLWQGRVTVEYDDDLAFDNQRYFAIAAAPAYQVLIVNGATTENSLDDETFFLESTLRLAGPSETFADSPFSPAVIRYDDSTSLPSLADYQVVVLVNVKTLQDSDAGRLGTFVRGGGGLLVFTGDQVNAKGYEPLAKAGLTVGEIGPIKVTRDLPWRINKWDEKHDVFMPLNDPQHGDLRRLIFAAYTQINPSRDAHTLAEFKTGDPAVIERVCGKGTVIWVAISCGRDWSDWGRSRLFLPLVHQLVGFQVGLTQGGRVRNRLLDAENIASKATEPMAHGASPLDNGTPITNGVKSYASTTPPYPGIYQLAQYAEVVSTNPRESDTESCSREDFENRFGFKLMGESNAAATTGSEQEVGFQRQEKWHWVASLMLVVVLLEGFVGNRTTA